MINTYIDNRSEYVVQFTYHSLTTTAINTSIYDNTKVIIQKNSIVRDDFIKISPKVGISFSIYPTVKVS
jgi:ethanolamine utilization protein EutP (predicted NTPase)